ncbi:MAG TPA: dihydrofolate reductase family protein [Bdellovibrio sp.]|nr:dihydrofolate reductase family protein [Bdellovibrio sp.]
MGQVKVAAFSVSLDGYGAGPDQSLSNPLGVRGNELHQWLFKTKTFQAMFGNSAGETGVDNDFAAKSMANNGAWILGRNMFAPTRGPWTDDSWKGWWGENPPYHVPVFILSHHARAPIHMDGGTTFYFVTDGIESALRKAKEAAQGKDVRIGGGVSTIRQYLQKGLIDEMHFAYSPVYLGAGENLLQGIDVNKLGFTKIEHVTTANAMHVTLKKSADRSALL